MILIPGYYLIQPNKAFKTKLKEVEIDDDFRSIIDRVSLWSSNKVGDGWDDISKIKLLFMANLMQDYSREVYAKLFSSSQISVAVFDRWWMIERYLEDESFEEIESKLESEVICQFKSTGIEKVDFWIEEIKKKHCPFD